MPRKRRTLTPDFKLQLVKLYESWDEIYDESVAVTMCAFLDIKRNTYYYHADIFGKRARKAEDTALSKES